jgi:hypothetical protein
LVARLLWEQDVAGSNPVIPIEVEVPRRISLMVRSIDRYNGLCIAAPKFYIFTMDTVDLKRDIELLTHRLGKTQEYL